MLIYLRINVVKMFKEDVIFISALKLTILIFLVQILKMLAVIILYWNVTFKNVLQLWNDILFSADFTKTTHAQEKTLNQRLHSEIRHGIKVVLWKQVHVLSSILGIILQQNVKDT